MRLVTPRDVNTIVPTSMDNARKGASASSARHKTTPLSDCMNTTLLLKPGFASIVQSLMSPTTVISLSVEVVVPSKDALTPSSAPLASILISNS